MKNLLYKEFTLSVHFLTYLMMGLMALECLAPGYPAAVAIVLFGPCYTFLFIGINKGTTTNDLLYTCTLPIKRSDVVKARVFSTTVLQIVNLCLVLPLLAVNHFIEVPQILASDPKQIPEFLTNLLGMHQAIVFVGVILISYAIFDLIYLPWFYKTGKSVVGNLFTAMLVTLIVCFFLTFIIPQIGNWREALKIDGSQANYPLQIGLLLICIAIWIGSKFLVTFLSTRNLKKLDF